MREMVVVRRRAVVMGECVLSPWKPLALLSDDDVDKSFAPVWRHPGTSYVTIRSRVGLSMVFTLQVSDI